MFKTEKNMGKNYQIVHVETAGLYFDVVYQLSEIPLDSALSEKFPDIFHHIIHNLH